MPTMKLARAKYTARMHKGVLVVQDVGSGRDLTVTNDIENVVAEALSDMPFDKRPEVCVYQDSEGNWDGWDLTKEEFIFLSAQDVESAFVMLNIEY